MPKLAQDDLLCYSKGGPGRSTVRRHYLRWRSQQTPPLPIRCDEQNCIFHQSPLVWNSKKLTLVLDHKNGVDGDNRPENLRFLCPNCNSQQSTHGGRNKGRVIQSGGGFAIKKEDKWHHTLPTRPGKFQIEPGQVNLVKSTKKTR